MFIIEPGDNPIDLKDQLEKEPQPPDNFVDNTVKRGRLLPDGSIEWYGTQEAFPEGWDQRNNNIVKRPDWTPKQKGEDEMAAKSRKPDKEVLEALFKECDYVILRAAKLWSERSGIRTTDVVMRGWLIKDGIINPPSKPTVNPEFDAALTQPPAGEPVSAAAAGISPEKIAAILNKGEEAATSKPESIAQQPAPSQTAPENPDQKWVLSMQSAAEKSEVVRKAVDDIKAKYGLDHLYQFTPDHKTELTALVNQAIAQRLNYDQVASQNQASRTDGKELARFGEAFDEMKAKQDEKAMPVGELESAPAPEPVREITVTDVLLAELEQRETTRSQYDPSDNDYTAADEDPIPYGLPPAPVLYDVDGFKIELIQTAIQKGECWDLPNRVILNLIGQLKDLEVGA